MRHLLTVRFPHDRNCFKTGIAYPVQQDVGTFQLNDAISCRGCKQNFPGRASCNESVLAIHSGSPVEVLDFEQFISQFDNTAAEIKDRCDFLLYDNDENRRKIAFCELTCTETKYVEPNESNKYPEGKRVKAYNQMRKSLEALLGIDLLNIHILTFQQKHCVFGWREPIASGQMDAAAQSMNAFGITPASTSDILYSNVLIVGYGFTFIQVKYPAHYEW